MIEAALAHVARNRVEVSYARSDLFECRSVLMDDRARYLAQVSEEGLLPLKLYRPRFLGQIIPTKPKAAVTG